MPSTLQQKKPATKAGKKPQAASGRTRAGGAQGRASGRSAASPPGRPQRTRERAQALGGGMITSKVTERSQTTLPRGVRQVLDLRPGERVGYVIDGTGVRLVNPSAKTHEDPAIQQFLQLLGRHLETEPAAAMLPFPADLLARARAATAGVDIDHDAPIEGAISL